MYRLSSILFLVLFVAPCWADDNNGEAKASSQNAMKKVEDGDPVLQQNMMQHMMMAQMYEAQMNMPMAMQERMKAQMLQQQIQQNEKSRDKNEDRRDTAIYTSDASQTQVTGPLLGGFAGSAPTSTSAGTLGSFFDRAPTPAPSVEEQVSNEFLTFNESTVKKENETASAETDKVTTPTQESLAVPPQRAAELALDLQSIEAQYSETTTVASTSSEEISPVREVAAPPAVVVSKKKENKKEEDEFWKDPKKKPVAKRPSKRAIASLKKTTKSPYRSQTGSAHRSSPPDRKPR